MHFPTRHPAYASVPAAPRWPTTGMGEFPTTTGTLKARVDRVAHESGRRVWYITPAHGRQLKWWPGTLLLGEDDAKAPAGAAPVEEAKGPEPVDDAKREKWVRVVVASHKRIVDSGVALRRRALEKRAGQAQLTVAETKALELADAATRRALMRRQCVETGSGFFPLVGREGMQDARVVNVCNENRHLVFYIEDRDGDTRRFDSSLTYVDPDVQCRGGRCTIL